MASRYSNAFVQVFDGNADTLPGAKLEFFAPGTTTNQDTFSDSDLTTSNSNPVIADGDGRFGPIYLSDLTYKVVLSTASDVVIATADPIGDLVEGQLELWLNDQTYDIPDLVLGSDDRFYRSLTDTNQGNDPTTSAANWEEIQFERIFNVNVTYALGDRTIGSDGMEYFSLIAANLNNNPVTDATSTNWRAADQIRSADAAGTVDAITATYIPAVGALKDELILRVRALGANATTTPTFSPDSLTPKTIVKNGNLALDVADIRSAGHELLLVFNSTNDNYELLNPAVIKASQAEVDAGTDDTKFITPLKVAKFTSTQQTITSAGSLTLAHGLSSTPTRVSVHLVNTTAQSNYSIGDRLMVSVNNNATSAADNKGLSIVPDVTNLNIRFGSNATVFSVLDKTTGAGAAITNANWNIVFEAKI